MKDLGLLVWLSQLGLSVACPLAGFILLGVWLHKDLGWGIWTVWCGLILGFLCAFSGFRGALRSMEQMSKNKKIDPPPPVSFNDHQ